MINLNSLNSYKSIYLSVSGGVDSTLGFYMIAKHISEMKLNTTLTPATAVEPQPFYCRNDKNILKITDIIKKMFPKVNIKNNKIIFLKGYQRTLKHEKKSYKKVSAMRKMHTENIKKGDYNLGISFVSSFPKDKELKKHKELYDMSLTIGPENRIWTGEKYDKIRPSSRVNIFNKNISWWDPFINLHKKDFADLYLKFNLMDSLFPYTASCTGVAKETDNFTKPCRKCFWCLEKYWAFNMFDYPQAYNL